MVQRIERLGFTCVGEQTLWILIFNRWAHLPRTIDWLGLRVSHHQTALVSIHRAEGL